MYYTTIHATYNENSHKLMAVRPLISEQQIQTRIAEIGAQITVDYPDMELSI
jgi:hypoxanthine-guanine phosphoribosyltransferase